MTNFKDLLRDFAHDVVEIETNGDDPEDYNEQLDDLIEKYLGSDK